MHKGLKTGVCFGVVTTMLTASAFAGGYPLSPNNDETTTQFITSIQKTAVNIENEPVSEGEKTIVEEKSGAENDISEDNNAGDDVTPSDDTSKDNDTEDAVTSDDTSSDISEKNSTEDTAVSDESSPDTSEENNIDDTITSDNTVSDTSEEDGEDSIDGAAASDNISDDTSQNNSVDGTATTDSNEETAIEEYTITPLSEEEIEPLSFTADDFTVTLPGQAVYNGKKHEATAEAKAEDTDVAIEILYKRLPDTEDSTDSTETGSTDSASPEDDNSNGTSSNSTEPEDSNSDDTSTDSDQSGETNPDESEETTNDYKDEPIDAGKYQVALQVQDTFLTNKDWIFSIEKAERTLVNMPTGSILLYRSGAADTISESLQAMVSHETDLDHSAEIKYSVDTDEDDAKAITLTTTQDKATVTAVDNGVVKLVVTVPETKNYKQKQEFLSVCAVAKPLLGVKVTSSVADDPITAVYDEETQSIVVSGLKSKNAVLTYQGQTPTLSGTIVTADCKNSVMTVTVGGNIVAVYEIDESKVGVRTDGIQIIESKTPKFTVVSSITNQSIKNIMNSSHVQISNLLQATATSLQGIAQQLKTNDVESVTIEVCPVITVEAYSGAKVDSATGRLTLTVAPQYTTMIVKKNGVISKATSNLQDSQLSVPLKVSIPLPDSLRAKRHLIAKQTKSGGEIKYLPITIETKSNQTVAGWLQDGCGKMELIGDDTAYVVQFNNTENGSGVSAGVYYISDIGTRFPSVKNNDNSSSIAWKLSSSNTLYYSVTEEFLAAAAADMAKNSEHIAVLTPVFTTNSIPGVSVGGADVPNNTISVGGESIAGGGAAGETPTVRFTQPEHGAITIDPLNAAKDTVVTITGQPEDGYYMIGLTVQDDAGASVAVKNVGENQYTFVMPEGGATVSVEFQQFTDVPDGAYYRDAVQWAVSRGVTTGAKKTRFMPNGDCTRAQIVTFLWRLNGSPAPTSSDQSFTDVTDETAYYYQAVQWAVEQGITTGKTASTFCPEDCVTRGQTVMFLYRAAGSPALAEDSETVAFTDVKPSAFYWDAVQWAAANGVTTGASSARFNPNEYCTRAQAVTLLYRQQNQQ